jgi:hypothetical protein
MQLRTIRKINNKDWQAGAVFLGCVGACGSPTAVREADGGGEQTFVAVEGDFASFRSWTQFDGGTEPVDNITVQGQRTIYVNQLPGPDAGSFPVGTILVKTIAGAQTFAMVKRGGGFNSGGALGWEWLELAIQPDGSPLISWRGTAAPASTYSNSATMSCNGCHKLCQSNDSVCGTALQLSSR